MIVNPVADRGRASRVVPRLEAAFRAAGARFEIALTGGPGDAARLAERAAREGWGAVVAVGGDGAVHEVANGLLRAAGAGPTVPMGVVAVGSGNDFVKALGLPRRDPAAAVAGLVGAGPRAVDVGRVSRSVGPDGPLPEWFFTNGVGLGFDAQVAREARGVRRLRGMAIYAWALARTLRRLGAPRIRVVVDGREVADRPLVLATVANGPCHGGAFWLCPGAAVDDGLLDVLVADARSPGEVLRLVPSVMRGTHLSRPGVELHRARTVELRSDEALPVHADGEIVAEWVRELSIEVLPGRLRVLA